MNRRELPDNTYVYVEESENPPELAGYPGVYRVVGFPDQHTILKGIRFKNNSRQTYWISWTRITKWRLATPDEEATYKATVLLNWNEKAL